MLNWNAVSPSTTIDGAALPVDPGTKVFTPTYEDGKVDDIVSGIVEENGRWGKFKYRGDNVSINLIFCRMRLA